MGSKDTPQTDNSDFMQGAVTGIKGGGPGGF